MIKSLFSISVLVVVLSLRAQDYQIELSDVTIGGTLLSVEAKDYLAIIVAGSGPTNRNGNSGMGLRTDAYKLLADSLYKHNISTYRYDKRWLGQSIPTTLDSRDVVLEDYIEDVSGLVDHFANAGYQRVVLIGHSEGSTIALACAANNLNVKAVVSISGAGKSIDQVIVDQISAQFQPLGEEAAILFDSLASGQIPKKIHPLLVSMFRPEVLPFLASYTRFNPSEIMAQMNQPVMVIQGTTDIQVGEEHARMLHAANPKSELRIYEGMNHVLRAAPADRSQNIKTYTQPELPLYEGLAQDIVSFIKSIN